MVGNDCCLRITSSKKGNDMEFEILQRFFFWCMLVNAGVQAIIVIAVLLLRRVVYGIYKKLFDINEETVFKINTKLPGDIEVIDNYFQFRVLACNTYI